MQQIIFRQLIDSTSSTYTYLIGDAVTKKALVIDPVREQVDRDTALLRELGLDLIYAVDTHIHADHITGSGVLKTKFANCKSVLGLAGNENARADIRIEDGDLLNLGSISLEVRTTPGHTSGCCTLVWHENRMIFTGDALLIRSCGRTDFQEGDPSKLYDVVWGKILCLPDDFIVYPAHDYKGASSSTVGEEKTQNPRFTRPKDEFMNIMNNLGLPYPDKIDICVPANLVCGLHDL